jgi:DNA-binding LacI/PurR family transcriptional regulator
MIAEFDSTLIEEFKNKKTSVVFHDLGVVGERMSNIILDYAIGIDEAVRHLVSLGHSKIVHIAGSHEIYSAGVRQQAFVDAMNKYFPDEPELKIYEVISVLKEEDTAHQILSEPELPTAILVANDLMASVRCRNSKPPGWHPT